MLSLCLGMGLGLGLRLRADKQKIEGLQAANEKLETMNKELETIKGELEPQEPWHLLDMEEQFAAERDLEHST